MTFKFEVELTGASQDEHDYSEDTPAKTYEFVRDTSDNTLFKDIQVDDISSLIRDETVFYSDFDMGVYQIAANLEQKRIMAVCKADESISVDCKGIREFKGLGKKIAASSELGVLNTKREVEGLPPLSPEDFEITPYQKLNTSEEKALETGKIQVYKKLKEYRLQYGIPKVIPLLGEGVSFRELLPTCKRYKSNRAKTLRPLLLKTLRQWIVDEVGGVMTTETKDGELIECDDKLEFFSSQGYQHYRKHGWFNIGVISSDKDAMNSSKLLINADRYSGSDKSKKGKLKFPKPLLIEATDVSCGDLELISKTTDSGTSQEVKGYGFKFLMFQAFLGIDGADFYDALGHLGRGFNFGVASAYKVLKPCKTAKECLQACIDVFAELLPTGVKYTDHLGVEHDVDTLTYMSTYFTVAYMLRSDTDSMTLPKLCSMLGVDTSKITNNHIRKTKPQSEFDISVAEYSSTVESVMSLLSDKSGKVADKASRLEEALKMLGDLKNFDKLYED